MRLASPTLLCSFVLLTNQAAVSQQNTIEKTHKQWSKTSQEVRSKISNLNPDLVWQQDPLHYTFRKDTNKGWQWMLGNAQTNNIKPAFDHAQLAAAIKNSTKQDVNPDRLHLAKLSLVNDSIEFQLGKHRYRYKENKLTQINNSPKKAKRPTAKRQQQKDKRSDKSPDGKWRAYIKDGAVHLTNTTTKETQVLAKPKHPNHYYEGTPTWNPQSTHFFITYCEPGDRRKVSIVESSPKDQLQPKVHTFRYDKPGDKIDRREPHLFSVNQKTLIKPDRKLTSNAMSIDRTSWNKAGDRITYEYIERGYGKHYLINTDIKSGKQFPLIKEESNTYIHVYFVRFRKALPNTQEMIWGSLRDGWRHLYLLDLETGKVKNQITKGPWTVRDIINIDEKNRTITFTANGTKPDQDPYHIHYYRINFDGSDMIALTKADGTHELSFSPDKKYYIDSWSRVDQAPVHELRRTSDGKKIGEIIRSDVSQLLSTGRKLPERFVSKDRNNRFNLHGIIITPPNFDPKKKYPVLEHIYAGPHSAYTPKSFRHWYSTRSDLAEEGFVVVQLDALGTNYRHRDFSHFAYKNLVDSGLPDRIKWIKEAAKTRPWMDTSRVGIYGGSAGGQSSTAAVLHHSDFYKAAVSDCGCHDNRMDKIWWNEQWMDWPIGPHYAEQSNVTQANKLNAALMLTVGELDRNVDPASTTQLVDALIKANKDFSYFIVPGAGHGVGERPDMRVRRAMFFKKHLGEAR